MVRRGEAPLVLARMPVSLQIESRIPGLKRKADELLRFARKARTAARLKGTISITVESDERMRAINRFFRGKNKPTDVLSFPPAEGVREFHSGDIAISADIAAANAKRLGHTLLEEIKVLILHGMLHLAGFDHEVDSGEMATEEKRLRSTLKLPQSLIERHLPVRAHPAKATRKARPAKIGPSAGPRRKTGRRATY